MTDLRLSPINDSPEPSKNSSGLRLSPIEASSETTTSTANQAQSATQSPTMTQAPTEQKPDRGLIGGEIESFARSVPKGAADTALDVTDFVGELLSKPEITKSLGNKVRNLSKQAKEYVLQDSDVEKEYPISAAVGKGVGSVGAMVGSTRIAPESTLAKIGVQGFLGASLAGEGNRALGGLAGAFVPAMTAAPLSSVGRYVASNANQSKAINTLKTEINTPKTGLEKYPNKNIYQATDEAFQDFRSTQGNINVDQPIEVLGKYAEDFSTRLTRPQMSVVEDAIDSLKNAKTLEDLHDARKTFTRDLDTFYKGDNAVKGKARDAITEAKNTFETNLQENAKNLGVLDKYNYANTLYKQSREADIVNNAFKRTETQFGDNEWARFNASIQSLKKEQWKDLSTETKNQIAGIQGIIKEANHFLGIPSRKLWITPVLTIVNGMFNNSAGKMVLQSLGSDQGRKLTRSITESIINKVQSTIINNSSPPQSNQENAN